MQINAGAEAMDGAEFGDSDDNFDFADNASDDDDDDTPSTNVRPVRKPSCVMVVVCRLLSKCGSNEANNFESRARAVPAAERPAGRCTFDTVD